ncbi:MAG: hypothetical protein BGO51_03725 [Rhodospirillales bacterium 69-11]|nr:MAG: hypothetical protein BGO51_03725 [Rhodospirillales bacterium 69-11]
MGVNRLVFWFVQRLVARRTIRVIVPWRGSGQSAPCSFAERSVKEHAEGSSIDVQKRFLLIPLLLCKPAELDNRIDRRNIESEALRFRFYFLDVIGDPSLLFFETFDAFNVGQQSSARYATYFR